jgi:hypothetical protein
LVRIDEKHFLPLQKGVYLKGVTHNSFFRCPISANLPAGAGPDNPTFPRNFRENACVERFLV